MEGHSGNGIIFAGARYDLQPAERQWLTANDGYAWMTGEAWGWGTTTGIYDLVPVKLVFDTTLKQKAYCYLRNGSPSYGFNGYYDVPIRAYDVSDGNNPRQINLAFVEMNGSPAQDQTWTPGLDASSREFLFVLKSSYTPTPNAFYTAMNVKNDAGSMDILYTGWYYQKDAAVRFRDGDYFFIQPTVPVSYRDTFILNPLGPTNEIRACRRQAEYRLDRIIRIPSARDRRLRIMQRSSRCSSSERNVTLKIHDMLGRPVFTVYSGILQAGYHEIPFYAPPNLSTGLYTAVLTTSTERHTVRMTLLR